MSFEDRIDDMRAAGFAPARRAKHQARVLVVGTDVTLHAITWALEITDGGMIAMIDAEGDARNWAPTEHQGYPFFMHEWTGDYSPGRLLSRAEAAAKAVGPDGCVIVHTITQWWDGKGGIKDIVDGASEGWKVGGPIYRDMIDDLTRLDCHVVVTCRAKSEWAIEQRERDGELVAHARQVTTEAMARTGIEFDFELVARLDADLNTIVKTKASLSLMPYYTPGEVRSVMREYAEFLRDGVTLLGAAQRAVLQEAFNLVTDSADRTRLKQRFVREIGLPEALTIDEFERAVAWAERRGKLWIDGVDVDAVEVEVNDTGMPQGDDVVQPQPEVEEEPIPDEGDALHILNREQLMTLAAGLDIEVPADASLPDIARLVRTELLDEIVPDADG